MGSCSNKVVNQPINSIKAISIPQHEGKITIDTETGKSESKGNRYIDNQEKKQDENTTKKNEKHKYIIAITEEEKKGRKNHKKLTVLSTNDDELDLAPESANDLSLVRRKSFGKTEQGSLLIVNRPVTFGGQISSISQNQFEEKIMTIEGDDVKREHLLIHGIWVSCRKGLKPDCPNQDDFVVVIDDKSVILGVFDGHGSHGHEVSNFIHKAFPTALIDHDQWMLNPTTAISDAFLTVHNELLTYCSKKTSHFDCILSGSTATLVNVRSNKLYVGHAGDSRAVLGKRVGGKIISFELTRDHKPTLPDEYSRIVKMGGEVRKLDDDVPYRVFVRGKQYPGIAMSRTVGDALAQRVGVVCIAEVNEFNLCPEDEFILICSDGVWEFISNQEAVDEIAKHGKNAKNAAEALAGLAWNRWIKNEEDVVDDITVVLAYLKELNRV